MKKTKPIAGSIAAGMLAFVQPVSGQSPVPPPYVPRHIAASNGEVILTSPFDERLYTDYHFAGVRRAGDLVFFSGYAVGSPQPMAPDQFESRLRQVFTALEAKLREAGASTGDVVSIKSYHAWKNPTFVGTKEQHIEIYERVRDEFFKAPYPTWTAIGVDQLYAPTGVIEIELIAYAPIAKK